MQTDRKTNRKTKNSETMNKRNSFTVKPSKLWAIFRPIFQSALAGIRQFFYIGISATKVLKGQAFSGLGHA